MKKILFVESYPHVMFGQQRTLLSLLEASPSVDIEPVVAATSDGPFVDEARQRGIPVTLIPYPAMLSSYGGAIYGYRGMRYLRMLGQWLGYVRTIRRTLKALAVDGMYCNDMRGLLTAGLAARSLGLPVMIWDKLDKPHGWLDWLQLPLVAKNVIISEAIKTKYPAWQIGLYSRKIITIYNGADINRFKVANSIREEWPFNRSDTLFAIVGSITSRKGHDRIFEIWPDIVKKHPAAHLLVIGETTGSPEDEMFVKNLPNKDHPHIHFLGMRKDVPDVMQSIDVLIIPSRHEGMGQVTVEAMASKLPVIGANTGGIPEVVVHGETGLIVDGDDADGWKAAIVQLADSRDLRERMGEAGRKRVEAEFNRPVQMDKVLKLCREMVDGR